MSPRPVGWYGLRPALQVALEATARREYGTGLSLALRPDHIVYRVSVEVPGRRHLVPTEIVFYQWPPYPCWGLPPEEYPRVHALSGETSPHRMPDDDALCLYYPRSPAHERWRPSDGLLALIDLISTHLFFEDHWRATGAHRGGVWLGAEAPHSFPEAAA